MTFNRIMIFISCAFIVANLSCSTPKPTQTKSPPTTELYSNVVFPDSGQDSNSVNVYGHGDTLSFQFTGSKPSINDSSVLVGEKNGGYLRRITRIIDATGNNMVFLTKQATLADVIKQGSIDTIINIRPKQPTQIGPLRKVSTTKDGKSIITKIGGGLAKATDVGVEITLTNLSFDIVGDTIKLDTLKLSGTIDLILEANFGWTGVTYLKVAFDVSLEQEFSAGIGMSQSLFQDFNPDPIDLGEIPIGAFVIPIGIVPVPVVVNFDPVLKVAFSSPSIGISDLVVTPTISAQAGMEYNNGAYNPISNLNFTPEIELPQLAIDNTFNLTLGCEGDISTKIFDVAGPTFGIEPGAYMDFDIQNLCMDGGAYIKANAGVEFKIFGIGFSKEITICDKQIPYLHQCVTTTPPVIDSFTVKPAHGQRPLNDTFSYAANDSISSHVLKDTINFGDGVQTSLHNTKGTCNHIYSSTGQYIATYSVTDSNTGRSIKASVNIVVTDTAKNSAAIIQFTVNPHQGSAPLTTTIGYSVTDPNGNMDQIILKLGDGNIDTLKQSTGSMTHVFTNAGTYTMIMTADNGKGGISTDSNVVTAILNNIPLQGLIAYYPFNGNANDESGNGRNGIIRGNPAFVQGIRGTAISLKSSGGYMDSLGDHVLLPMIDFGSLSAYTLSMWVNEESLSSTDGESYIDYGCADNNTWLGIAHCNDYIGYSVGDSVIRVTMNSADMNRYVFYCLTVGNGIMKAYKDGILVGDIPSGTLQITGNYAAICRHWWNGGTATSTRFTGKIDDVRIYDQVLSDTAIQSLYQSGQ